jgi:hypothetical protein
MPINLKKHPTCIHDHKTRLYEAQSALLNRILPSILSIESPDPDSKECGLDYITAPAHRLTFIPLAYRQELWYTKSYC